MIVMPPGAGYRALVSEGAGEPGRGRGAAVAGAAAGAGGGADDGVHVVGGHRLAPLGAGRDRDFLNPVVGGVRDVQVARGVDGGVTRAVQLPAGGGAAITAGARRAVAGDGVD